MFPEEMEIINKIGKEAVINKLKEKLYIRGNPKELRSQCPNCGKVFYKNNPWQVVFFCSKGCRRDYKTSEFKVIK